VLRILGRYVFREILTSSVLGTVLATFVVFLQQVDKLFEVVVAGNPDPRTVMLLLAYTVPPVLPLTIPFGVLVGILIGLGRMASDGEIVAMRAAGVSSRKVIAPVLLFATLGASLAAVAALRWTPYALRQSTEILYRLAANQTSGNIQPRIFDENLNRNTILYVGDVRPGDPAQWRNIFIADVTPPEERKKGAGAKGDGPLVTVARAGLATSDPKNNRIQLELREYYSHEMGKDAHAYDDFAPIKTVALETKPPEERTFAARSMNTRELLHYHGPDRISAGLELHRRFALPLACIVLALVGIPVGISTRKGGRSAAYVNAIFLAFFGYYLSSLSLIGMAQRRRLPIPVASWLPDVVFGIFGLVFLIRMERPGDSDLLSQIRGFFGAVADRFKALGGAPQKKPEPDRAGWRLPLLPQIVDTYILQNFLFYLALVLASFVSMTEVFNFFELMGDMLRNSNLVTMLTYLFFLIPQLVYRLLPISVLMAALVTLGVLSKQNEVTAFKACGVSLYRLAAPVLIASTLCGGALFGFNYSYVPAANRRQDALRDQIKGRVTQTYLNPNRKWIMGSDSRIYYYKYFDPTAKVMVDVSIFELDPATFRLKRQIQAQRAEWHPTLHAWLFEEGWSSDFEGTRRIVPRHNFQTTTFPELNETPDYFLKEVQKEQQMNFLELQKYIADLQQSGLVDTRKLQVQYHLKFANPLFAVIMAMIAVPFGFLVGNRGAMTGIGASIVIAISYLGIQPLFEKIGDVGLLPPAMAAWSPDVLFSLVGLYLLLRMRS
jgi:LPS export ABC transporter permease LptG/LPS export ABC transporter permease LptF